MCVCTRARVRVRAQTFVYVCIPKKFNHQRFEIERSLSEAHKQCYLVTRGSQRLNFQSVPSRI